jgi:hypothetical protein
MAKKSGHPLGVTGRVLFGAAITTVGMGLSAGVASAEPADTQSTQESRPAPAVDVRTMTDQELSAELGRVAGKDSLRQQEVVTEMKARGGQFWEAAPAPNGIGISGGVPVRPGVSVTGTIAYDPYTGSFIVSGGVRAGTPSGPKFTGIAPKPDGLNANGTVKLDLGEYGEFTSSVDLNLSPEGEVSGSYTAKGTVTTPDGRSYETEVKVERNADGTIDVEMPDGYTTTTQLPGGGTIENKTPADPLKERPQPEIKAPAPKTEEQPQPEKSWSWRDWFDFSGALSIDKEIRPDPLPTPTPEELEQAKKSWAEQQRIAGAQQDAWRAQNRPEAQYREALERAQQRADAAAAAERAAMPDRDHDGIPDAEDRTWNQNDTDPASADVGDGPDGGKGYPSDRVESPAPTAPPESTDPNADHDRDGVPDKQDATWNQNDTDPASADVGDGPEGGEGYPGDTPSDADGDGLTGAADPTPNQNDTDPASTDRGDGPEGGEGYGDADGDGLTGAADATPNQNDTDPAGTDVGDGPEGGEGYGGGSGGSDLGDSGSISGSLSDSDSDSGGDSGSEPGSGSGSGLGSDSGSGLGSDSGSGLGSDSSSDSGSVSGGDSGSVSGDSGSFSGSLSDSGGSSDTGSDSGGFSDSSTSDADGDGLSGSADSTPNQNDTDPSSTDVGDGPEGNAGYGGSTDSGGYGTDSGTGGYGGDTDSGSCACV